MQESLMNKFLGYLRKHMVQTRWRAAAVCVAGAVVFCTTYLLILPAITMTKGYPSLSAEVFSAWSGDDLSLRVKAGTEEGGNTKIYVLTLEGYNADLSAEYVFNEEGTCTITDTEGKEIVLHRAIREDGKGAVDYWFSLEEGERTEFTLDLSDSVDPNRFAVMVEAMKSAAEESEMETGDSSGQAETATASNASKPASGSAVAAGSGRSNATPSDAEYSAASGTASPSDAGKTEEKKQQPAVVYEEEDGFVQLQDGDIINDLEEEEETESTETVASVKISAGFGKDFYAAVKDAARNADKRGDAQLKFSWKEMVQSEKVITPEMFWSGDGAQVLMIFDGDARLPEGAYLSVDEIPYGSAEYEQYLAQAAGAVIDPESSSTEERAVNFARFFDISILDPEGNEVEPAAPVRVIITCDESIRTREEDDVNVLHFKEEQDPQIMAAETVNSGSVSEEEADAVTFTTDSFSVYGVVTTTIEKTILASDGHMYRVTVTCGTAAGIPRRAELSVREILPENASGEADPEYEEYTAMAGSTLGFSKAEYYRLFDISIVDQEDPSVRFQPKENVDVRIELLDAGDSPEAFAVLHFAEEAPEQLEASTEGNTVSFSTGGFSAYAIVRGPEAADNGWTRVSSLDELAELSGRNIPLYISHVSGYYFTDILEKNVANNKNRTGIRKTAPSLHDPEEADGAVQYYFEKETGTANGYRVYCLEGSGTEAEGDAGRKYIRQSGNSLSFESEKDKASVFTAGLFPGASDSVFNFLGADGYYWNMQGSAGGKAFAAYNKNDDPNAQIVLEYKIYPDSDPYELDGKTYGLMHYSDGLAGRALTSAAGEGNALGAVVMTIMTKQQDRDNRLYVPKDSEISMWTFHWVTEDNYYVSAPAGGAEKYLNLTAEGAFVTDEPQLIKVTPGTGGNEGQVRLSAASSALVYSGEISRGFVSGSTKSEDAWLYFVDLSELTKEYFTTYSASKVSISDTAKVTNGARVIIYTRVWNETKKRYEFFALGHDGTLVPCYESGDSIEWIGTAVNTLLWNFTEYYYEGTTDPNYYYELYNQYSQKYIAPQIKDGQLLSDAPIGININGRRYGDYYSTIIAWDDPYYAYAGLRTENRKAVSGPMSQAEDFYFALMQDVPADDTFTEVPTVDHTQYGITMKMVNFGDRKDQSNFLGDDSGGVNVPPKQGLLTTDLSGTDGFGYPSTVLPEVPQSLKVLFDGGKEVNQLFIESIYSGTGYFEFDSAQNFAHLNGDTFQVYKELGTNDSSGNRETLKHGQFFPYDMMVPGLYASVNGKNLYSAEAKELPESDPRKYEQLHLISKPDYNFGMEMSASFVQTPDGLDAWGHDIIFEFSGDDDFWLYVDGELVIDLGGIHSALPGTVNFCTGEVTVNNVPTTLYDVFRNNYVSRGMNESEIAENLNRIFEEKTVGGVTRHVFRDYSSHTMRMFYMERGKGASNLHMRFNLSAVKPGQILLQKQISGTDKPDYKLAEYAYQIQYRLSPDENAPWLNLGAVEGQAAGVTYQNTSEPVKYLDSYTPVESPVTYRNVFFLSPGQIAAVTLPKEAYDYRIIECGVNAQIYDAVKVNDKTVQGTAAKDGKTGAEDEKRKDYVSEAATGEERRRVVFDNHVDPNAIRTLTITKKLFDADGSPVSNDPTGFSFRLYLGHENEEQPAAANTQDYYVKDPEGNYCFWDVDNQKFSSLGKKDFGKLSAAEKERATFHTSPNGGISKIPADHHVEVRDLLVGTRFRVEEREGEIPVGYTFIKYEREGASYIVDEGDTVNAGVIRDNDSPAIEVHNRRGFGISAEKVWSDAEYMESHGDIHLAVFVKKGDDRLELVEDSIQTISHPAKKVSWYWDRLQDGASLSDYVVREVAMNGSAAEPVGNGDYLTVEAKSKESDSSSKYAYAATYTEGQVTGTVQNVRTDTVTNSRHGIRIEKKNWDGSEALPGAVFRLTDPKGNTVGQESYTSGEDGLVTVAYLNVSTEYTLTEIKAPAGYQAMEQPLKFILHADGTVDVTDGSEEYWSLAPQTSGSQAVLTVKNRPYELKAVKQGVQKGNRPLLLGGVHFALYKEVTVDGITTMDFEPMEGFEDLVSEENTGIIPGINELLPAGTYYLDEKETPLGYTGLEKPVCFSISPQGEVTLRDSAAASGAKADGQIAPAKLTSEETETGTRIITIAVKNELTAVPVEIVKIDQQGKKLEGAIFNLSGPYIGEWNNLISRIPEGGTDAVIFRSEALRIGTYTLTEISAPEGCIILDAPVIIKVEDGDTGLVVTATVNDKTGPQVEVARIDANRQELGWRVTVINTIGYTMPSTGGPGTRTISIIGLLLVLMGGSYLLIRRQRNLLE